MNIGDKFKCKYKGEVKYGIVEEGANGWQQFIYHIYDVRIGGHNSLKIAVPSMFEEDQNRILLLGHNITDFEILQEEKEIDLPIDHGAFANAFKGNKIKYSDFKEGRRFKCNFRGLTKYGVVGRIVVGNQKSTTPKLNIYDVYDLEGDKSHVHYMYGAVISTDMEKYLAPDITEFEFLPDVPEMTIEKAVKQVAADTYLDKLQFTDFNKDPILCSLPKKYIVSLVFNNTKGVQNTVDVVSATCVHEALGAAIEKQMKVHQGLIVYEVMDYEVEDNSNTK